MPNMCTGAFDVLHRPNNSCAIYAIYTVVLNKHLDNNNKKIAVLDMQAKLTNSESKLDNFPSNDYTEKI